MSKFILIGNRQVIERRSVAELDYGVKLKRWLTDDDDVSEASKVTWTTSPGLEKTGQGIALHPKHGRLIFIKVKGGGAVGAEAWATAIWTTDQGRTETLTLYFKMVASAAEGST